MACTLERRNQIGELAAGRLDGAVVDALLDHIEVCEACSRELDTVAVTIAGMERARRGRLVGGFRPRLLRPAMLAAAALVLLVGGLALLRPNQEGVEQLAVVTPFPASSSVLRGGEGVDESGWEQALSAYSEGDYERAAARLESLASAGDERALLQLYLGVARLQLGELARARTALALAVENGEGLLAERASWYLGNAHLLAGDASAARPIFERLAAGGGEYELNARAVLDALGDRE